MNWDYTLIFKNEELFNKACESVLDEANQINKLKNKLHEITYFKEFLNKEKKLSINLEKIAIYANLKYSKNSKDIKNQELYSYVNNLFSDINNLLSFAEPELISIGYDKILNFIDNDKSLESYQYYFHKLFLGQSHILDSNSENLLAKYSETFNGYNRLYNALATADAKSNEVILNDGSKILVNKNNFNYYLQNLKLQEDREKVFNIIYSYFDEHKTTFASIYNYIMQTELANMKARNYNSILESHLAKNNINIQVYLNLMNVAKSNTSALKKYYNMRKKYFKLDKLHTYDRFLTFVKDDKIYDYEEAKKMFFAAVKKIGGEFEKKAHKVLELGRVDVLPQDGKRGGAFSTCSYECGNFIMLNHNNNLDSVFTLAHEAGHSMHSLFANETQPYETSNYVIFVAEIASTFNEALLLDYLLSEDISNNTRIALLQKEIDNIISTFYRQTLFATYEYEAHKLVSEGRPITSFTLSEIMKELYLKYYGLNLEEEPLKQYVWAYIPHLFNTPFYVYQYATSYAASLAIYERVKKDKSALDDYLNLLKAGGANYPLNLVRLAGVDLEKEEAFMAVCKRLSFLVDELEEALKEDE